MPTGLKTSSGFTNREEALRESAYCPRTHCPLIAMRQPLKQLNEIFDADPRSASFVRFDAIGRHPKTIEDHYEDIAAIRLSEGVPPAIRDEFDTIRNLYLYSWYVYDFSVAADQYAYALIEKTIKEKCRCSELPLKGSEGLKTLLKLSIRNGWLTNAAFDFITELTATEIVPDVSGTEPPSLVTTPRYRPSDTDYCESLVESLPYLRNKVAHGDAGLGFPSSTLGTIRICACIANALFPNSRHDAGALVR